MKKIFSFALFVLLAISSISFAQGNFISGPEVTQCIYHDTSPPLRDIPEAPLTQSHWQDGIVPLFTIPPKFEDQYQNDPVLQETMGTNGDGFIFQTWDGIPSNFTAAPPDNNGDVGPNHYFETVNSRFQIWNKTGTSLLGPLSLGTIWSGFPGPWSGSLNDGDPIVLYDEAADRWFIAQFSLPNYPNGPSYIIIAVSQTGDPTGSWNRYGFSYSYGIPDYPKFGVWPDGYYMSANAFSSGSLNFSGTLLVAFERSQMLTGATAQSVSFTRSAASTWSLLPSDWNGSTTPPANSPNYFLQLHDNAFYGGNDGVDIYQFHVDWVTPANSTFTGPNFLATSPFAMVNGIPQQGTGQLLADMSDKAMNRLDYRNFGTHQSMVICHTINAGSGRAGTRWYEFRNTGAAWSLYQEGTYAPADGLYRWMGSIAINAAGHIALGYSVSSTTMFPAIRYTGRYATDPIGQMTLPEETIFAGAGSQTGGLDRWGDYTSMNVDPNGINFWYVNQYQPSTGSFNWRTRIANIDYTIPVELVSFAANALRDKVELNWTTATETNNQGFEIQRMSVGGVYENVGYAAGFGTTTEPKSYSFIDSKLEAGSYTYRLKQIDFNGSYEYSNEINVDVEIPLEFALEQNYPNPFNPTTKISYSIPEDGFVKLAVYNLLGEEVAAIVNTTQKAGRYEVNFNASGLSSGVYVYRIEAANFTASKKLVLMK